jgi:plastocyanin
MKTTREQSDSDEQESGGNKLSCQLSYCHQDEGQFQVAAFGAATAPATEKGADQKVSCNLGVRERSLATERSRKAEVCRSNISAGPKKKGKSMRQKYALSFWLCVSVLFGVATTESLWAASYQEAKVADGGAVEGKVVYRGAVPAPRKIIPTQDQQVCGGPRDDPRIILGKDNTVQGAIVYLRQVEKGKPFEKLKEPPVIDNVKCKFEPELQAVPVGSEVIIRNSDPVLHNTHGYLLSDSRRGRTVFNVALPQKSQTVKTTLKLPGVVDVACDVHWWMQAWILIAENPYYDDTDKSGTFTIKDIPPGKYTLVTFHPHTGIRETPVTVEAKKTTNVNIELKK